LRVRAIINPRAGLASMRALTAIEQQSDRHRIEIQVTRSPGHACELAQEAAERGDALILAVGGDGTVNEVARGVLGHATTIGLVPVGSGNGLARTLGISRDPKRALQQLETGVRRMIDVGFINNQPFLNVAGVGFDALVAETYRQWGYNGGRRGLLPYFVCGLRQALKYGEENRSLTVGGVTITGPAYLVVFANGRQYGGGAIIAPHAYLDDGRLEAVHIARLSYAQALRCIPRLFLGSINEYKHYRSISGDHAVLDNGAPVSIHRDGEPEEASSHLEIRIASRALGVIVPRRTIDSPRSPFVRKDVLGEDVRSNTPRPSESAERI
jgi:diacylglycerol kinase (ATP)